MFTNALGSAAGLALAVAIACAAYDACKNRKKYGVRERRRKNKGGLD